MDRIKEVILYLYVLAQTFGGPGLFLIALADSSFLSVPEGNDLLIVVLSIGQSWERMYYLVAMTILGSVAGCSLLYWVGRKGRQFMLKRGYSDRINRAERLYQRFGLWAIIVPCVMPPPTPFKIFVLSAGVLRLSFPKFLMAVLIGRTIRYLSWGILAVVYGVQAKTYIEENFMRAGLYLFGLLVFGVLAYLVYLWISRRRMDQQAS